MLAPCKKDTQALPLGLCRHDLRLVEGGDLRLRTRARRTACPGLPRRVGQASPRRVQRLQAELANSVTESGCMSHARRKFVDPARGWQEPNCRAGHELIGQLYQVEREARTLSAEKHQRLRAPPPGEAHHWRAVPTEAGSLRSGQCAANITSLIWTAKLRSHEPHAYLKDVQAWLPTHGHPDPRTSASELATSRLIPARGDRRSLTSSSRSRSACSRFQTDLNAWGLAG